ncbi:MAG: hypothetical protein R6V44_12485 [Paracoccaceae bacterium]
MPAPFALRLRRGLLAFACGLCAAAASVSAAEREELAAFHRAMLDVALDPPAAASLRRLCAARASAGTLEAEVTFAGFRPGEAALAVLTDAPIRDVSRAVWLEPRFVSSELAARMERDWPELTLDWGWVFDRNGDGRVDWYGFVIGPVAVAPEGLRDPPDLSGGLDMAEVALLLENTPYRFWQIVDSDFDGAPDALLAPAMREDGWAEGVMLLEGIERPGGPDACCWRSEREAGPARECRATPSGCETPDGAMTAITARFGPDILRTLAGRFRLVEAGARACGLRPGALAQVPRSR